MTIHGQTSRHEWVWINYWDNGDGIDQRIVDWFRDRWREAYSRDEQETAEAHAQATAADTERAERAELERLRAKYRQP